MSWIATLIGMAAEGVSRWELEGRADYAQKLARWLLSEGWDPVTVGRWTDGQWLAAAQAAGVRSAVERRKVPSAKTQGMVIGLLTPSPVHESFYVGRHHAEEHDDEDEAEGLGGR